MGYLKEFTLSEQESKTIIDFEKNRFEILINTIQENKFDPSDWLGYRFKDDQTNEKPIIIVLPVSVPGMGKSYWSDKILRKICEKLDLKFISNSCDQIRENLIKETMFRGDLTKEKAFKNCSK